MDNESKIKVSYQVMVISGIFCMVVALLLVLNFWHMKANEPLESATIEALVKRLKSESNNEELKEEIRNFDLLARKAYFTSQWQVRTGAWLLLIGGIVFAIALKIHTDLKAGIGKPEEEETPLIKGRLLTQRWILIGGLVVLVLALVSAWLSNDYLRNYLDGDYAAVEIDVSEEDPVEVIEIVDQSSQSDSSAGEINLTAQETTEQGSDSQEIGETKTTELTYYGIEDFKKNHNMFRGLFGHGVDYHKNIPTDWDGTSGKNIKWKVAVPKHGYNSPIIWEDKLFLAGGDTEARVVYCYNRHTGQLIWERTVDNIQGSPATPPKVSDDTGLSAPTMTVDGYRVYAIFATGDLIAFDLDGNRIWARNMGVPINHYGHSSSLLVWKEKLIIQYDTRKGGRMIAVNTASGETIWDVKRDNQISWSSPILIEVNEKYQVVTSSDPYVAGHDLETGEELWKADALMGEVGPSPAYYDGLVYATQEYARLVALKPEANAEFVWESDEYNSEAPSPVAANGLVFLATNYGVVVCYDAKTGEKQWEREYPDEIWSSPMVSDGKLYVIDKGGIMHIIKADKSGEEVGHPELGENAFAIPIFADNMIYMRGNEHLFCIGE